MQIWHVLNDSKETKLREKLMAEASRSVSQDNVPRLKLHVAHGFQSSTLFPPK